MLGMANHPAPPLAVSESEAETLRAMARAGTTEQRTALRAKIILQAAEGVANVAIADELGSSVPAGGAGGPPKAAPDRDVQVQPRSRARGQGDRRRRAVPCPARAGDRPQRRREDPDPGPRSDPAAAAAQARPGRAPHPPLQAER